MRGALSSVSSAAAGGPGLFPAIVTLDDAPDLRAGLTTTVRLVPEAEAAELAVPLTAVVSPAGGRSWVHRVDGDQVSLVEVEVLRVGEQRAAVRGELDPGDEVVVAGHVGLAEGAAVEVRR